jgi:hypothetical protein
MKDGPNQKHPFSSPPRKLSPFAFAGFFPRHDAGDVHSERDGRVVTDYSMEIDVFLTRPPATVPANQCGS